jgi:hypothetical protein
MGKIVVGYPSPYHKTMPLTSILKLHCLLNPFPVPKPNPNPNPCPVPTHAFATPSSLLIPYTLPETNHLARFGFAYSSILPSTNHLVSSTSLHPPSLVFSATLHPFLPHNVPVPNTIYSLPSHWSKISRVLHVTSVNLRSVCFLSISLPSLHIVQAWHHRPMLK